MTIFQPVNHNGNLMMKGVEPLFKIKPVIPSLLLSTIRITDLLKMLSLSKLGEETKILPFMIKKKSFNMKLFTHFLNEFKT